MKYNFLWSMLHKIPYKTSHLGLLLEGRCIKDFHWEANIAFLFKKKKKVFFISSVAAVLKRRKTSEYVLSRSLTASKLIHS